MPVNNGTSEGKEFLDLIASRHSKRAFLPTPVDRDVLGKVLSSACQAPSAKNMQPWRVVVVSGAARDRLSERICSKFDQGIVEQPDYRFYPEELPEGFAARARECGLALYRLKGIARGDEAGRRAHERENYTFFHAPVVLVFHMPRTVERAQFLDMGFFMQNVMLGLRAVGLSSCPQLSLARYSGTIRSCLGLPADRLIVCGLSVGYADEKAPVNAFVPDRLPLSSVVQWVHEPAVNG
ncbi:MAG TPA: nitroreductase [Elusimicrobiota bacterium]|nr:nitroreductase [Elusimicrobiota bacterium]